MTADRPNILFVMTDQLRHDYLGCAGADWLRTPNIDALAARGVRFTQCTTNAPVCAPARIGLASGQHPARIGSLQNHSFLPTSAPTYYQRLRDHDYRVACVGKLDIGKPARYVGACGHRPRAYSWGFTHPHECEGKMSAGRAGEPHGPWTNLLRDRGLYADFSRDYIKRQKGGWTVGQAHDSVLPTDLFEDCYIGRTAADWIAAASDDYPWHMFVSFVGPHDPFDPPTEYADRYRDAAMPPAIPTDRDGKAQWVQGRQRDHDVDEVAVTRRQYSALIELIDDHVGLMLGQLEKRGQLDNTIVVVSSDHGEMLGDHGLYQKSCAYEGALRVPLIVAGPGIAVGRSSDALVELIDVNPTISELAGLPAQPNIDARSFVPVLTGLASEHRNGTISELDRFQCTRTRDHKLITNTNDVAELYDLNADPDEHDNIAVENSDICRDLHSIFAERRTEGAWHR
jgi:arylsulfatase A-like enzyme